MKSKKYFQDKSTFILFCLVAAQLIALTIYNLFNIQNILDYDSAPVLTQTILSWEQGTLFLKDWWYTTNLGWDTSIPLATVFYGVFHNVYFAYGLADTTILYALLYIYYRICKRVNISTNGKLIVFLLLLTPYSIGQLDYMNMLLASQASYNIRALLTMTMISIMLEFYAGKTIKSQWAICIAFIVMLFASSCSSSLYALISCVLPVLIFVAMDLIREDRLSLKSLKYPMVYFPIISSFVAILGIMFSKYINITNGADSKAFTTGVNFGDNFIGCLVGIFELLGGIKSDKSVAVLSAEGISIMLKLLIIFLLIFALLYISHRNFKNHQKDKYIEMALTLMIVNLGILIFADTTYGSVTFEYRYLIIPVLPLFIFVGYLTDCIHHQTNHSLKIVYFAGLSIICLILNVGLFSYAYKINDGYDELKEIKTTIDSNGIGLVNIVHNLDVQNTIDGKILKTMEADSQFIISDGTNVDWWVMSDTNLENCNYSGKTAILTQAEIFESLPAYYTRNAILSEEFSYRDYNLYILDSNPFDYYSGFPKSDKFISVDFPYSYLYNVSNGMIDSTGKLHATGTAGTLLDACIPASKGDYLVTLYYSMENGSATFSIKENDNVISSIDLRPEISSGESSDESSVASSDEIYVESTVVLDNISISDTKDLNISISVTDGTDLWVNYIEFRRK